MTHHIPDIFLDKKSNNSVFFIIVAGVVALLLWAGFSNIEETVQAQGRIIPSGKVRTVQHFEGGIVEDILVRDGQTVSIGDALYVINNIQASASGNENMISADALRLKMIRLEAELSSENQVQFSEEDQQNYPEFVANEVRLFQTRNSELKNQLDGYVEKERQKELALQSFNTKLSNLKAERSIARKQYDIQKNLRKVGAVSESRMLQAQSVVKGFDTQIASIQKQIPITQAEKNEISNQIKELKQNHRSEILEDLKVAQVDLLKLQQRQTALSDRMDRTTVVSPVNGVVKTRYINTIGGVVPAGGHLVDILPTEETLIVEARIRTDDRAKIYPGLKVNAMITAYDYTEFGGILGELTEISADSFTDQQGAEYYTVKASLFIDEGDENMPVFSGMTVQLNIIGGEISVLQAVLKPFLKVQSEALREW